MNTTNFLHEPSPDHPGWYSWDIADRERFNGNALGPLLVRTDGDGRCRLRLMTEKRHANLRDRVHGGVTLALVDVALFAAARTLLASDAAGSVTLELSTQFIGAGSIGEPLDVLVEVVRETGRLVFLRGSVVQLEDDSHLVASFAGIIRKPAKR